MRRDLGPRASSRGVKRGEGGKEDKIVKMKEMGSIWAKHNSREPEAAYILKVKKSADSTFQSPKICRKSA